MRAKKAYMKERQAFNQVVSHTLLLGGKSHELHAQVLEHLKDGNTILRKAVNAPLTRAPYEAGEKLEKAVRRTDFVVDNLADLRPGVLKRIMGTQAKPKKKQSVESQHMVFMMRAFKMGKTLEEVCTYFPQYTKARVQNVLKLYTEGKIKLTWKRGTKVWS